MPMRLMLDQAEAISKGFCQGGGIVALHRQAAAFLRAIRREGRDDRVSARLHAAAEPLDIGLPIGRSTRK